VNEINKLSHLINDGWDVKFYSTPFKKSNNDWSINYCWDADLENIDHKSVLKFENPLDCIMDFINYAGKIKAITL